MSNYRLDWQSLLPNTTPYRPVFSTAAQQATLSFAQYQPRLADSLTHFCHPYAPSPFMLLNAEMTTESFTLIHQAVCGLLPPLTASSPACNTESRRLPLVPNASHPPHFAATHTALFADWCESEELFGTVRGFHQRLFFEPGLVHKVNGGVLILSLRTLLAQPLLWLRLKKCIIEQRFRWLSPDESRPLPLVPPEMPLNLKLILVGDREGCADFQNIEPELCDSALYGEFELEMSLIDREDMQRWCALLTTFGREHQLPPIAEDAWVTLVNYAIRTTGDQSLLNINPSSIMRLLREASRYNQQEINAQALREAITIRHWRESYLSQRMHDDIEIGQILIETEGEMIGQINGLSVLDYPGHPLPFGEPSRITCVVHLGDGEFTDVERKAELGGNLHAKGMMIMQAFLISELKLEQQLPFSASLVFEQSYGEVDGDSASLAELCVLISALAMVPINQQVAVTGSVDQFGHVQPIGGVNEKIEGFFEICHRRGLTGSQGVIIPSTNICHLCLNEEVINAVKSGSFHLWAVDNAEDALPILTGLPLRSENGPSLVGAIQERIALISNLEKRQLPWLLRWLHWFYPR